ncbi:hypothetical protein bcere0026_52840 [Bacillus mycoides]|uniref:Uncharacterized protein n=1 Tax=Bacillus mycoides TaxID=1405 RepID=C2Y2T7_BACMY|nr:hypothetical protein bcere0026_52840 [Bacillus mycoides]
MQYCVAHRPGFHQAIPPMFCPIEQFGQSCMPVQSPKENNE